MNESNNIKFLFLALSFLFVGTLIASKSFFIRHEIIILGFIGLFIYQKFFWGYKESQLNSMTWLWVLFGFFVLNMIPSIMHAVIDMYYGNRLKLHVENLLHLVVFAIWYFLALRLNVSVVQLWKLLIASSIWVFWVLFYEIYTLNGFGNLAVFISEHRFGSIGSVYYIDFGIFSNTLFLILLGAFFWLRKLGVFWGVALAAAIGIDFVGAVLSQSLTAWIGWPEALIAWTIFYSVYLWSHQRRRLLFMGFSVFLFLSASLAQSPLFSVLSQRTELAIANVNAYFSGQPFTSVGERFVMYQAGWESFMEHPYIGVGPDKFKAEFKRQTERVFSERFGMQNRSLPYGNAHNQFMMSAMQGGILAILSLILLFSYLFYTFVPLTKNTNYYRMSLGVVGVVFTIASIFAFMPETPLYQRKSFLFFFFMVTLVLVMVKAPLESGFKNKY